MEQVFLKLVHMSVAAGWLVLAVLVLRLLLKRAPRWTICLLWALVAVRLVCPLSIESRFSLVPRTETVVQSVQTLSSAAPRAQTDGNTAAAPAAEPAAPDTSITSVLGRAWFAGMVFMLGWALWSDLRLRRRVRASIPQQETVLICDEIDTPFVLGLFRPRIYLPSDLDPAQAVYVLAHENAHIARRDHWWKPLGWVLLSVYWFHPLLWLGYVLLCRDLELACDERVAGGLDRKGLAAYSEALLQCSSPRRVSLACPVTFSEVSVKQRVKSILRYKKPGLRLVAVSLIVVFAAGLLFLTDRPANAVQLPEEVPSTSNYVSRKDAHIPPLDEDAPTPTPTPTPAPTAAPTQTRSSSTTQQSTSHSSEPTPDEIAAIIDQHILENTTPPPLYVSPGSKYDHGEVGVITNPSSGVTDSAKNAGGWSGADALPDYISLDPMNTNTNPGPQSALPDGTVHYPTALVPGGAP